TPPRPRRRPPAWLTTAILPAVVGAAVALGVTSVVDVAGDDGRTTTVIREVAASGAPDGQPPVPLPAPAERAGGAARPGATPSIAEVYRQVAPSVVRVESGAGVAGRLGTGFVIDRRGHVLTNAHVIQRDAGRARVVFGDGSERDARVLGRDEDVDLAVLRVEDLPEASRVAPLGSVRDLTVGDAVIAIGNPLGFDQTVTSGIVSALKRPISSPNDTTIQNVIQTDAAINQGNSGGPLLDARGRVVGINSQIATESGGNDGIGFAVPVDTVRPVAASIIATGEAQHAWMGIQGVPMLPAVQEANGLGGVKGVMVVQVDDRGPARQAGLRGATSGTGPTDTPRGGDVIVAVNGRPVEDMADVSLAVTSRRVGDRLTVTVLRDGTRRDVAITLGDRPGGTG
ncbi:MAG TPA: trypsin-like peptidase domain-containing protein, partial [Miltoncostaeaceae bacterium]|nr:trypsin-like peptidase domain-containing protein [Miltoncostaeaceae bacterium]